MSEALEARLVGLLQADARAMTALHALRTLALPDAWIAAGFVRAIVWDRLHGFAVPTPVDDIDVIYFDPGDPAGAREPEHEARLRLEAPGLPWSVRNQARMHRRNADPPYADTADAMRSWLETPTCVGARLNGNGGIEVLAPFGLEDLFALRLRPTGKARRRAGEYRARLESKPWRRQWPRLQVEWP